MKKISTALALIPAAFLCFFSAGAAEIFENQFFQRESIQTAMGAVEITFIGHGSLMMKFNDRIIHIDPYSSLADYAKLPNADLILLTHHHPDHLDPKAIAAVRTPNTVVIATEKCAKTVSGAVVMKNGDTNAVESIFIRATPAYNRKDNKDNKKIFHPKGEGNGYVIEIGDKKFYVAGDTENIPEMKKMTDIDYAFLPMNRPYTMTPEMAADAAAMIKPKVLYPYHYGETDPIILKKLLKEKNCDIEVRIRSMS